ncbi:ATP-grasp domain-containing protein [Sphingobium aquiterrae]|uniref:ATP-grasp domain-containing protein n=1 Tax=Sphingobium aquiterrae TaxID=2038656 RepID=UPI003016A3CF
MSEEAVTYPYAFAWSKAIEDFFVKKSIYLLHPFKTRGIYREGDVVTLRSPIMVEPFSSMSGRKGFSNCGAFSYMHSAFGGGADVGRYCSIAPYSRLIGNEHPLDRISTHPFACRDYYTGWMERRLKISSQVSPFEETDRGPLIVGNDVWIGNAALIRRGITIGHGAVVAAGALVVKDVPPFAIVGGAPAKVIRYRFDQATIARILDVAWWRYHVRDLAGLDVTDIHGFLDALERRVARGEIEDYRPPRINIAEELHGLTGRQAARAVGGGRIGDGANHAAARAQGQAARTRPSFGERTNARIIDAIVAGGANDFSASDYHGRRGDIARHLIGDVARAQGFAVEPVRTLAYRVSRRNRDIIFQQNAPDISVSASRITLNKVVTKALLARNGLAVPAGRVFTDQGRALAYFRTRTVAQVVKPAAGAGGHGVTAGVMDEPTFASAWQKAAALGARVIVEDFVAGDEVRIITIGGRLAAAICRVPAHVIGDGVRTIGDLVARKNAARRENPLLKLYPVKSFDQLELDGRAISDIPSKGERVRLSTVSNVAMGGESVSVIDRLHPSIVALAEKAARAVPGAILLGLDILVKDFAADADSDGNICIIEINSNPAIATPCFAAFGPPASDLPRALLDCGYRKARAAERDSTEGRIPAVIPAAPYHAACGGDSFRRDYSTQMRLIRQAAYARNLRVDILSQDVTILSDHKMHAAFFQGMSDRTRAVSRAASNNKEWTKNLLREAGVRTPRGAMFQADAMADAWAFAQSLEAPVVIKPMTGSGGAGVATEISSFAHFDQAWREAAATGSPTIMVEDHHGGRDYRVLVIGNAIRAATQRIPAHLVGDGVHTVDALIAIKNEKRRHSPHDGSKPIKLTPMMVRNLAERNMDGGTVLAAGQYLQLHSVANIGSGGESLDVSEHVHPGWTDIAVRTRKAVFDPLHIGFDLIAEDIARSPDDQRWVVIEVNANPDMGLHHFVTEGTPRDTAGALVEALFPGTATARRGKRKSVKIFAVAKGDVEALMQRIWRHAHLRALSGTVCARSETGVEVIVSGPANAVDDMVRACTAGSRTMPVSQALTSVFAGDVPEGFEILRA